MHQFWEFWESFSLSDFIGQICQYLRHFSAIYPSPVFIHYKLYVQIYATIKSQLSTSLEPH